MPITVLSAMALAMLVSHPAPAQAQQRSVLATMSDGDFCRVFQRNIAQVPEQATPPFTIPTPTVDCREKRIRATVNVAANGQQFTELRELFVATARSGVCNLADPTMAAFHNRGWRYAYRFVAGDGEVANVLLNC